MKQAGSYQIGSGPVSRDLAIGLGLHEPDLAGHIIKSQHAPVGAEGDLGLPVTAHLAPRADLPQPAVAAQGVGGQPAAIGTEPGQVPVVPRQVVNVFAGLGIPDLDAGVRIPREAASGHPALVGADGRAAHVSLRLQGEIAAEAVPAAGRARPLPFVITTTVPSRLALAPL